LSSLGSMELPLLWNKIENMNDFCLVATYNVLVLLRTAWREWECDDEGRREDEEISLFNQH
jgi:hypothetical protein